jgi:hypothetical protein
VRITLARGKLLSELAKAYPTCTTLLGVDASLTHVEYIRARRQPRRSTTAWSFMWRMPCACSNFPPASSTW